MFSNSKNSSVKNLLTSGGCSSLLRVDGRFIGVFPDISFLTLIWIFLKLIKNNFEMRNRLCGIKQ